MLTFFLALRNVTRNRERSLLTLIGVMLAIGSYVALVSLAEGLGARMTWEIDSRNVDIYLLPRRALALPSGPIGTVGFSQDTLPKALLDRISALPNVALAQGINRESWTGKNTTFPVIRIDRPALAAFYPGLQPLPAELSPGQVLLGSGLAAQDLPKKIQHGQAEFRVAGVVSGQGFQNYCAFVHPEPNTTEFHEIWLQLRDPNLALGEAASIQQMVPDNIQAITRTVYLERTSTFVHYAWLLQVAIASVGVMIAITASMNTMLMSTYERLREFAVLRAIGASRATVAAMLVWESVMLSLIGGVLGCLFGLLASGVLDQAVVVLFQLPFPLARVALGLMLQGLALSVLVGLCGAIIPLILIWRQRIMNGLRSE